MKSLTFFLFFFSFSTIVYSQIDVQAIINKAGHSRIMVDKPDKMTLYGLQKDKIDDGNTNFYYFNSGGNGQENKYLDNNNIDLFQNKDGEFFIIYTSGFKRKLVDTRNCYYAIEIDDKNKKAEHKTLYEEDKLSLKALNLVTILSQKGFDKYDGYSHAEILLGISPPVYFFRMYHKISGYGINLYNFSIELMFPKSFLDLYKTLSPSLINKSTNDKIVQKFNELMQQKISMISSLAPKGEFETTEQYKKRINEGQIQKLQIEKEYKKRILVFNKLANAKLKKKILQSLKQVNLKIDSIGEYNADKQIFPITINGLTKNIKVPLEQAKEFKAKEGEIKVLANEQLIQNGETFRIFDIRIINPITGRTIVF